MFSKDTGNFRVTKHYTYHLGEEKFYFVPEKQERFLFLTRWVPIEECICTHIGRLYSPYECIDMESAMKIIQYYKDGKLNGSHSEIVYSEIHDEAGHDR